MMPEYTSLALCTLVVNWTLTLLAFLAVLAICWFRPTCWAFITRPDDTLVLLAFLISTVLVSLTTWAIVDEGQAKHQKDVSASQLEIAAKVCLSPIASMRGKLYQQRHVPDRGENTI